MNITLFICLMFALQLFYWFVGRRASKNLRGKEDYFLAGKNVRLFPLMMTFMATEVGGGVILGAADEAYRFGWPVLFYPLGGALGFILIGSGIGSRLASFKVSTVAQILEVVYGSVFLKRAASILSVLSLFMILVGQITASSKFLASIGFSNTPLFILFWAIVVFYTMQGGLKAVIYTDLVQATLFTTVFLGCFAFVLFTQPALEILQASEWDHFDSVSTKLCGWVLMPMLFMLMEQSMGQRCFAGASPRIVSRAALFAGVVAMVVCVVPVFFGTLAQAMGLEVPKGESVLMTAIAKTTSPSMTALVGCAVLAAIISTVTALINAIGSNLSGDFKFPLLEGKDSMLMVRAMTCAISIAAIFFAFYFDNIVDILIQSYELSVSCMLIPVVVALFKRQGNFLSALMAMVFGAAGFVLFRVYSVDLPREIASILLSLCGYGCGEVIVYYQAKNADSEGVKV